MFGLGERPLREKRAAFEQYDVVTCLLYRVQSGAAEPHRAVLSIAQSLLALRHGAAPKSSPVTLTQPKVAVMHETQNYIYLAVAEAGSSEDLPSYSRDEQKQDRLVDPRTHEKVTQTSTEHMTVCNHDPHSTPTTVGTCCALYLHREDSTLDTCLAAYPTKQN